MAETVSQPTNSNGLAILSLVLGIISLLGCWVPLLNIATGTLAFAGLIVGIIAVAKKQGKMAMAGLIISIVSIVVEVLEYVLLITGVIVFGQRMEANSHTEGIDVVNVQLEATSSPALVKGTLVNNSGKEIVSPIVSFSIYDLNGELLDDDYTCDAGAGVRDSVVNGGSWSFTAECPQGIVPSRVELKGSTYLSAKD